MQNLFETALRRKLRFDSPRGQLTIEDLWDLPLQTQSDQKPSLDRIAIDLRREIRDTAEESIVSPASSANEELQMKFDVVKYIIDVRLDESAKAATAAERNEKKQKLMELISRKKDAALEEKSVEELTQMVEAL